MHKIAVNMNGVGTWYDNAPTESFSGTLKSEWVHHCTCCTRQEVKTDLPYYIEAFHNRRRLHSAVGYVSPDSCERLYHQRADLP
ncbi:MAG: IS3 family transposase [Chloroflexota bacterium]|nr:IS3 family transposase [Chloroflexota bacterium]